MRLHALMRPSRGALVLSASLAVSLAICPGRGDAADAPAPARQMPGTPTSDQLRVHTVADQLIGFLSQAVEWVDQPSTRAPLGSIRPRIQAAVLAHPEVRLASEQRVTAGYASREAFAGYLPQVSGSTDTGRRRFDAVNKPWIAVPAHEDNSRSASITARQLIYDFGAVSGRVDAQGAREVASEAKTEGRRSEITLKAITVWHEIFRARQMLKLSEVNRLSRQQILNFIEEREQLGGSSKSDVLRARARLSDAQSALVAAENRLLSAEASYRETFNASPPAEVPLPEAVAVDLARFTDTDSLIRHNALFAEALAQSEALSFDAKSAGAAMMPSLHFELSATRRDLGSLGIPGSDRTAGVVIRHNFYSGGAEAARKSQAEQKAVESRLELESLRRQLERAIGQTLADARNSDASVAARKEAVQVAALAFDSVREQFAFRRGTLLDLLRAQEDLYLAGRDLIDGVVDHALARHRLLHLAMELTPLFELGAPAQIPNEPGAPPPKN